MPSASKIKGSGFEREIAKYLSEIYGEPFIRAPGSGAYTSGTNSHRKQMLHEGQIRSFKGDIVPGQSFVNFNAEVKFYADFQFHQLFDESKQLESWIKQLMTASDPDDLNILFMKFNRKGRYVAVQSNLNWNIPYNHFVYHSDHYDAWIICELEKFFTSNLYKVKTLSGKKTLVEKLPENTL
jgi:hypothetical protein